MTSLYKVLGVDVDASSQQIKAAYKKLALKYHPDKNPDDTEAKAKFLKIQEAYQILSSDEKRRQYDLIEELENNLNTKNSEGSDIQAILLNLLINLLNNFINKCKAKTSQPPTDSHNNQIPPDIRLTIEVDVQDIYNKTIKIIKVKVLRNNVMETISLALSLVDYKEDYIFENMGDNEKSNIIVSVKVKPHEYIYVDTILDTYNLSIDIPITLYEYYYETDKKVQFMDEVLSIDTTNLKNKQCKCVTITGKGLTYTKDGLETRGDLHIFANIMLPAEIPEISKNFLSNYFNKVDGTYQGSCV